MESEISKLSLQEMRAGLSSRKFSALELVNASLKRANDLEHLSCFLTLSPEMALAEAKEADKELSQGVSKPLLGIPVAIKDAIVTKGVRTTCASKMLESFIPPYDATVILKLKEAGAIILGKLNMDEFAMGSSNENSAFSPVRNPWNPEFVPGGSSGGSAAAVAAGICPITLGSDTGGSIRQPAAFCGVAGLKPTYGRVSRFGLVAFASSLDQIGPFGKTVRDCAVATSVIGGFDANDSTSYNAPSPNFEASLERGIKGLRVGIPRQYFIDGMDPEVLAAVRAAINKLAQLGAQIVEIDLPHTDLAVAVYYILAPAEASSNLARFDGVRYGFRAKEVGDLKEMYLKTRSQGFGSEVKRRILLGTYVLSSGYYDAYYVKAQKVRSLIANDFKAVFANQCDIIAAPTTPTPPFKLQENVDDPLKMYLNDIFTIPLNLAGLPGISIPCGFSSAGLPIGFQLIGKAWDEETIFSTAYAYEQATEWHKKQVQI